jgi:hypothetical protein
MRGKLTTAAARVQANALKLHDTQHDDQQLHRNSLSVSECSTIGDHRI